jgi:hypothetical protein
VTAPPHGPAYPASPDCPLTPGEALAKLFLDNADRGVGTTVAAVIPVRARWTLRDLSGRHTAQRQVLLNGGTSWNRTTVRPVQ